MVDRAAIFAELTQRNAVRREAKLPLPVAGNTATTLLPFARVPAAAMSPNPSWLKSPIATKPGLVPAAKVNWLWKVPLPLPRSTLTLLSVALVTARSVLPSPLISPAATEIGPAPVATVVGLWKVPLPLPSKMLTL